VEAFSPLPDEANPYGAKPTSTIITEEIKV